jgi:uncharacterized protein
MSRMFLVYVIIGVLVGAGICQLASPKISVTVVEEKIQKKIVEIVSENVSVSRVATKLVAVDEQGNGVIAELEVAVRSGEGRILVNIERLLFWVDTQYSIQVARDVAFDYLNVSRSAVDLIYTVRTNGSIVGGPSAGAAICVATIAALQNKELREDTVITGRISPDGKVLPVGDIVAKARAAKEAGFTRFLVPTGQAKQVEYQREERCERIGAMQICRIEYTPVQIDVEEEIGIEVIEVNNIVEVADLFLVT